MAYVPMGGYAVDSAHYPLLWDAIKSETEAAFLKLEPGRLGIGETLDLRGMGFQPSRQTIQPPNSIIIDISTDDETIMQRMNQSTRRKIRKSLASRIEFQEGTRADLGDFSRLMLQTGERNEFGVHSASYFEKVYDLFLPQHGALWLARYEDELLAAIMVFSLGDTAWYLYGASSRTKSNLNATYGIQWAAIQWAKKRGCRYYDLWGIPDDDEATLEAQFKERRDGLWGVYGFKRGWGGEVKRSLGAWGQSLESPGLRRLSRSVKSRKLSAKGRRSSSGSARSTSGNAGTPACKNSPTRMCCKHGTGANSSGLPEAGSLSAWHSNAMHRSSHKQAC